MDEVKVTRRDALAKLWLPWCVEREFPNQPIRIERKPERRDEARQLRVSDLGDEAARIALSNYLRDDGRSVLAAIQSFAADYAERDGRIVIDDAKGFPLDEGLMLCEACHRSCGIYKSGVEDFEIQGTVQPLSWMVYDDPVLRMG